MFTVIIIYVENGYFIQREVTVQTLHLLPRGIVDEVNTVVRQLKGSDCWNKV